MRFAAALGLAAGLALAAWLLSSFGFVRVLNLVADAGWPGLLAVAAVHVPQVVCSAAAWRAIAGPTVPQPGLRDFVMLRWIREAVNNLLPVGQIGGDFVSARLLRRRGVKLTSAIAGAVGDVTVEVVTQIGFTLLGLLLLLVTVGDGGIAGYVIGGLAIATAIAAALLAAQWFGSVRLIEAGLLRLGRAVGWHAAGDVTGLHDALIALYRSPRRVWRAAAWHSLSWLLGGVEVCLALHVLGHDVSLSAGLVIESLGQALKTAGFAIPGALGIQEGGYIVVCRLFGVSPELAIALSLVKRLREIALGLPGLAAWRWLEAVPVARSTAAAEAALPQASGTTP
jgi:putative membrane protein